MQRKKPHLRAVSGTPPCMAQTVQQLKYDTLLVYLQNLTTLSGLLLGTAAEGGNLIQGLIGVLPYKGNFGGGGDGTSGGTTS